MTNIKLAYQAMIIAAVLSLIQYAGSDKSDPKSTTEMQWPNTNYIKITDAHPDFLNWSYFKTFHISVKKLNNTYNKLALRVKILKDFPSHTKFTTTVEEALQQDHGLKPHKRTFVSYICDPKDEFRDYLPSFLKELIAAGKRVGKCVQKGNYNFDDAGQFEFYKLMPLEELINKRYLTHDEIRTSEALMLRMGITSKSVYTTYFNDVHSLHINLTKN